MRNFREDWKKFKPELIPTKTNLNHIKYFLEEISTNFEPEKTLSVLDLGCGAGIVSHFIYTQGFSVVGVDINPTALIKAKQNLPSQEKYQKKRLEFYCGDITNLDSLNLPKKSFNAVVCQLVLSIIGTETDRRKLLNNVFSYLQPGGYFYLSASGVSNSINNNYAKLYEADHHITQEYYTYLSRDREGKILYQTHHFRENELRSLLKESGFCHVHIHTDKETSSRQKDQSAYFHYCYSRVPR